jgi:outer membrane protein assembly factor BamB
MLPPFAFIAISFTLASLPLASAQDWPQYLGENRAGKASFGAPESWPDLLVPKWKVTVGDGVATPALVGDKLYVFTRQDGGELLLCLNPATGKELWRTERYDVLPANGPASPFPGPRCSPTVADGKVVTLGLRGTVSCFDASNGKLLWRQDDFPGVFPRFFTSASPLVADGLVIAALGGGDEGGVIAYDLNSGAEKWRWAEQGASYASPVLLTVGNTRIAIAEMDKKFVGLTVKDGAVLWETPFEVPGRGYNASTAMAAGDVLIYGGSGRPTKGVKFSRADGKLTAEELWSNDDSTLQFNTPILKDGLVFGLSAKNDLFCLGTDGRTAWSVPATGQSAVDPNEGSDQDARQGRRGGRNRGGYAQIVDCGPVLLALTPAAELIVFKPDAKSYQEVARLKVADSPTYAYPVVSGKRIYVKDQNDLALFLVE